MNSELGSLNLSIQLLGCEETHDILVADMYDLVDKSEEEELTPIYVRLGSLFLDIGICSTMRLEQDIPTEEWTEYVEAYRSEMSIAYKAFKLELIQKIESSTNGKDERFFSKLPAKMKFFYDPDEPYVSLVTCSKKRAKPGEPATKSGHLVVTLRLQKKEIMFPYQQLILNQ